MPQLTTADRCKSRVFGRFFEQAEIIVKDQGPDGDFADARITQGARVGSEIVSKSAVRAPFFPFFAVFGSALGRR
jgi:hypothetical protein